MVQGKFKVLFSLFIFLFLNQAVFGQVVPASSIVHKPGASAYKHVKVLSEDIGQRATGTIGEQKAKSYIYNTLKEMGYNTTTQDFSFTRGGTQYSSANIVAVKPGKSDKVIIVGGHYDSDSESDSRGTDDSASGIGVILEVAEILKNIKTPYTIKFVAFGAEEKGLRGSKYYVSQMSTEDIQNTVLMINLDSLAVGDKMYVYGDEVSWAREQALDIARKLKLNLETNPGLNSDYPIGTTGPWSDHAPFEAKGIPYAYFEATNWELGELDGYTQTVQDGEIWHTDKDTLSYIESAYPGRIQEHLSTFSQVLENLLKFSNKASTAK